LCIYPKIPRIPKNVTATATQLQLYLKNYLPRISSRLAFFAIPFDAQPVFHRFKTISLTDIFLQSLDPIVLKFDELATFYANYVIMMLVTKDMFITDLILAMEDLPNQITFN